MLEIPIEIGIIFAVTLAISGIFRLLKQPLIIGYIVSGIVLSSVIFDFIHAHEIIEIFAKIGVTFLLFIIGMSLSPKVIKEVGKTSVITGVGQIVFTTVVGFIIAKMLGFSDVVAVYVSIALTFSSTIIIMKLLSDKNDTEKLYGKISIGFLLVQDVFVILLLIIIPFVAKDPSLPEFGMQFIAVSIILVLALILASIYVFPRVSGLISRSKEYLFLFAASWSLGIAALFDQIGLSMEIGALIAGIAFSTTPYRFEISSKMKPLRDFFLVLFFVLLGSQMIPEDISHLAIPAIVFSAFVLVGNPFIVMILMGILGYKKKTGFKAGLTVAQISEFSIIFVALGIQVGHLSQDVLSLVTIVGLVTIGGSTYMILYSDRLYSWLSKYLGIFERRKIREGDTRAAKYDVLLFGYGRTGSFLTQTLQKHNMRCLVIDHDPKTIHELSIRGIPCIFRDAEGLEFEDIDMSQVKMIISLIPDSEINLSLIHKIDKYNQIITIVLARDGSVAKNLYDAGATYVLIPHHVLTEYLSSMIEKYGFDYSGFVEAGKDDTRKTQS